MATTRTLPVSGGVITKPALTDTADISVISTDMENIYQEFVSQNNKATVVKTAQISQSSWSVRRVGNIVFNTCVGGSYDKNSNNLITESGTVCTIPTGYRPVSTCEIVASYPSNIRIQVKADGTFSVPNDPVSNLALRFSACWITTDDYPS